MSALADDAPRGFIRMAEYLKLRRKCDDLEARIEEMRPRRFRFAQSGVAQRTLSLRALLPGLALSGRICVLSLAELGAASHEALVAACCSTNDSVKIHILRARRALEAAGAPPQAIHTEYGVGYAMTEEARAWLRARVPEAFTQQGASR